MTISAIGFNSNPYSSPRANYRSTSPAFGNAQSDVLKDAENLYSAVLSDPGVKKAVKKLNQLLVKRALGVGFNLKKLNEEIEAAQKAVNEAIEKAAQKHRSAVSA